MFLDGKRIGRYYFQSLIEQGGMGDIYLAWDSRLHRRVAIKVMSTLISGEADTVTMNEAVNLFKREARAVTMLDHPYILSLYDYGEETFDGMLLTYIVMPYRPEGSLAGWISKRRKSGKPTLFEAAHFLRQAASALQYAHDHGIIHRDVKPSNFLIVSNKQHPGRPDVQLADFGVAKFMRAISTPTGIIRGTPLYMAPEFWKGVAVPASDQYALALMIYEIITGSFPFQGDTPEQLLYQHMYVEPPPPSMLDSSIPPAIDAVLMRALTKNPANRYGSMAAFAKAFHQALVQKSGSVPTPLEKTQEASTLMSSNVVERTQQVSNSQVLPPQTPRTNPPGHRKRNFFITALAILLILSGIGFIAFSGFQQINGTKQIVISTQSQFQSETAKGRNEASQTAFANDTNTARNATNTAFVATSTSNAAASATSISAKETAVSATSTAIVEATATAIALATTTAYNEIIMVGPMKLNNTMQSNNPIENWDIMDISTGAGCTFIKGSYHAGELKGGNFSACFEHGIDLADFSYQVDMTILKGDQGGIAFRANPDTGTFYYFYLDTHGNYALELVNSDTLGQPLAQGFSVAINKGFNVPNLIAVVAKGSSIQIYVNMQPVTGVTDSSVGHGNLGVVAQDLNTSTDVSFNNAQAWQCC